MNQWKTKTDSSGIKMFAHPTKSYYVLALGALLSLVAFFVLWADKKSEAGAITSISVSTVAGTPNLATETYTVAFTPATTIPAGGIIHIGFQWDQGQSTIVPSSPSKESGTSASISSISQDGNSGIWALAGSEITGGTAVTIKAGGLTNPATGRYYATVWTKGSNGSLLDGSTGYDSTYRGYYTIGTPVVMGRVLDPSGNPLSGAWVNMFSMGGTNPMFGGDNADDQGYYAIGGVNNGPGSTGGTGTIANGTELKVSAFAPPEQFELGSSAEESITWNGLTITKNIQFITPAKTISGAVTFSDGSPVSGARVNFWSTSGSGWGQTETNSSGQYSIKVRGGQWGGMVQPDSDDNWSYSNPPINISFKDDASTESQTVDFSVQRASSTIAGSVRLPDGSVPAQNMFHVGIWSMGMGGSSGQLDANGNFSVNVAAGTYSIEINDFNQSYAAPEIQPVTVVESETKNLGTITLLARNSTISGQAVDQNGTGVANIQINTFMMKGKEGGGGGWANATTDANGNFILKVFPGRWMVQMDMWGSRSLKYVLDDKPQEVKIGSGETKTVTLHLVQANSTIAGSIVDTNGNVITDMWGWVFADKAAAREREGEDDFFGPGLGGPADRGQFSISVPAGTYNVGLGPMPGSSYSSGEPTAVTVADGQTVTQNITVYANDMTVSGSIKDENGNTVSNVFMEVFATNKTGGWQNAFINQGNGTYSLNVSSAVDPWSLGYFVDPQTGYFSERLSDSSLSGNSGDAITKDITIRRADATISGVVLDGDGSPMSNVFVFADNRTEDQDREEAEFHGPMFMNDNITDANGQFNINIPNGTYFVGAAIPRDDHPELINPNRLELILAANETKSGVTLSFVKANAVISGKVTFSGTQEESFVWAWSEKGGYNEAETDENGNYSINVTQNDTWHVGVNSDVTDTTDYIKSSEVIVETGNKTAITQDLGAELVADGLIEPESTSFDPTNAKTANLSDGTAITIPANSMSTDEDTTITLSASSTSEVPRTLDSKPIGTGLDLTAMDDSGTSITSFNSSVSVNMPYDETLLTDLKVTEDDLLVSYWDETNGIWQPVDSYSVDKDNNQVTFSTDHFTIFAVVSNTVSNDTTTASLTGTRATVKSWKAEMYRSPLGAEKLKLIIKGRHFKKDADVTIGGKSADSVKISNNGDRLTAKFKMKKFGKIRPNKLRVIRVTNPDAESRRASRKINLNNVDMRVTHTSSSELNTNATDGIRNIQTLLFNIDYLKRSGITGTFGPITRDAVIRFQRDHDIPTTGNVGPLTRAKLNERNGR